MCLTAGGTTADFGDGESKVIIMFTAITIIITTITMKVWFLHDVVPTGQPNHHQEQLCKPLHHSPPQVFHHHHIIDIHCHTAMMISYFTISSWYTWYIYLFPGCSSMCATLRCWTVWLWRRFWRSSTTSPLSRGSALTSLSKRSKRLKISNYHWIKFSVGSGLVSAHYWSHPPAFRQQVGIKRLRFWLWVWVENFF